MSLACYTYIYLYKSIPLTGGSGGGRVGGRSGGAMMLGKLPVRGRPTMLIRVGLVGWLSWAQRPFETIFQSISGRLPKRGRKKRKDR